MGGIPSGPKDLRLGRLSSLLKILDLLMEQFEKLIAKGVSNFGISDLGFL